MEKQNKKLLLKDICERLPYNVKVLYNNKVYSIDYVSGIYEEIKLDNSNDNYTLNISNIKPYLLPLSSMTDEQKQDYQYITELWMYDSSYSISNSIDWLNAHHFDYRGLIEKGLAIDATNLNIY